jgi:hypothetical protein
MRYAVDAWAPEYGASLESTDDVPTAEVAVDVEIPAASWAPIPPHVQPPGEIAFVDGVSRVDAQIWITEQDGSPKPGLCTTYAAGIVRCNARAHLGAVEVGRTLFTASGTAEPVETSHARYVPSYVAGTPEQMVMASINRMRELEATVARAARADLIVLDGLLWGRVDVEGAIGYVKSHRTPYLPEDLEGIVARLEPGERTPLFLVTTKWSRFSWYLRLPGGSGHPWAGIVRCEASPDLPPAEAARLADLASASLPRFASARHRDPRAPQNLYPIAGLERELRRRSGDARLLYRSLLAAARH